MAEDIGSYQIRQYDFRVGTIYPSAINIIESPGGQFGIGEAAIHQIMLRTTQQMYVSAPDYGWKTNLAYPTKQIQLSNLGSTTGQAPTEGIYTGIGGGCAAPGVTRAGVSRGNNPWS